MNDLIPGREIETAPLFASMTLTKPAISVFGLGYVGAVSMACIASLGHRMIGVDPDLGKVARIASGRSPIVEEHLDSLLTDGVDQDLIEATTDARAAVLATDMSFVSVGTPTAADGGCDFRFIREVARQIGSALAEKDSFHLIVLRCSVPPGTTREVMVPELEAASGKRLGDGFAVAFNPEFLREGRAVSDFFRPTKTVIGASDQRAAEMLADVYRMVDEEITFVAIETAEMVKYVDNTWHATKVAFANEVGRLSKAFGTDSHAVMDVFCQDRHLNLSPYYLKPGFAFGGSCLPKEVRAMQHLAQERGVSLPLIDSLTDTNDEHIASALRLIEQTKAHRVGFLGVTFKPDTDDLRESPTLELVAACLERGLEVSVFDPNLHADGDLEGHYAYMRHARPHLRAVMTALPRIAQSSAQDVAETVDCLVVSHNAHGYGHAVAYRPAGVAVIDLVRLFSGIPADQTYHGIGW